MRTKRPAAAIFAACIVGSIFTAGVAAADPDSPTPDPDSGLCTYPDVNNPYCSEFNDDHDQIGPDDHQHDNDHDHR
ncbi:MAG: hypothetical protein JWN03_3079 [Nocardia sp.]|uniref:hypothetical protein n=1 Tax=Nocardia sp. TaxID=1821 RepID=UPI00261A9216|nr:hypothetical protein [Nocardia sp.]MCU1642804.1 hypothetical protein [Nocardia sp.]